MIVSMTNSKLYEVGQRHARALTPPVSSMKSYRDGYTDSLERLWRIKSALWPKVAEEDLMYWRRLRESVNLDRIRRSWETGGSIKKKEIDIERANRPIPVCENIECTLCRPYRDALPSIS